MEILGRKGLGSWLKILLQVATIMGVIILVAVPLIINDSILPINPNIIILYPNAVCLLIIMYQFIGLFESLKNNNPFCENTVKRLMFCSRVAGISSIFWIIDLIIETFIVKRGTALILVLSFLSVLFIGVTIALYILAELFDKALEYKSENDLTI